MVYALAFLARAVRLELLLPKSDRLPFGRAFGVSAATTFLLQVIPFRGGEVASWGLLKRELGTGWARAGAVFALAKSIDSAATILLGLAGATVLASQKGRVPLALATGGLVALGAAALLSLPWIGSALLSRLVSAFPEGSRRRSAALEMADGLKEARSRPGTYLIATGFGFAFLGGHVLALALIASGLEVPASLAGLAFATLTSVLTAAAIPSPAGTFGPMESGFALGLAWDGVPPALGVVSAAVMHLVTTAVAGLGAAPVLLRSRR